LIASLKLIQGTDDEEIGGSSTGAESGGAAQWLLNLRKKVTLYYSMLPLELRTLQRAGSSVKNPLFRFLERECSVLSGLLQTIRRDFTTILEVCNGERKSTNNIKALAESLHADVVPKEWKKYTVPDTWPASEWLTDFQTRVEQMAALSTSAGHGRGGVQFGALISPEAYLIATQQATAQQNKWSLEELELKLEFAPSQDEITQAVENQTGFIIRGLSIESAQFDQVEKRVKLTNTLRSPLPTILLQWRSKKAEPAGATPEEHVLLPLYLNRSRKNLLASVKLPTYGVPEHIWYQRGVALFA
jgi:dynein heavy chain 1